MGKVSDYISSLDGKENIDPIVIASTLLELHNEEMGIAEGKIAALETEKNEIVSKVAEKDQAITQLKAKNWDLVNRIPATDGKESEAKDNPLAEPSDADFDDFFEE